MVSEAASAAKQARLRSLRDLDAAALKLRDAAIVILDPETPDDAVRTAVFDLIDRQTLDAAVERVGTLAEPHDDTYFTELRKHNRKIAYTPGLLAGLDLGAAPAGRSLLEAIDYLRVVQSGRKRAGPPPTAFASKIWLPQLKTLNGAVDLTAINSTFSTGFVELFADGTSFRCTHCAMPIRAKGRCQVLHGRPPGQPFAAPSGCPPSQTKNSDACRTDSIRPTWKLLIVFR